MTPGREDRLFGTTRYDWERIWHSHGGFDGILREFMRGNDVLPLSCAIVVTEWLGFELPPEAQHIADARRKPQQEISLKDALEAASEEVRNSPPWLKRIYEQNEALDRARRKIYTDDT